MGKDPSDDRGAADAPPRGFPDAGPGPGPLVGRRARAYRQVVTGYGFLLGAHPAWVVAGAVVVIAVLAYRGAAGRAWFFGLGLLLWGFAAPVWALALAVTLAVVLLMPPVRRALVTKPLMRTLAAAGVLPTIGETERVALEAGTVWIEGELFTGRPDFDRILSEPYPELTPRERAFLDGPAETLCAMANDWEIHRRKDLSPEAWAFIREERFLGMAIPEAYGGHGFSANGMRAVVSKLASRSVPLAVDVMVPNSLGPAELLVHYGTEEQKAYWLPRLATGEEIPCFALTEPDAGSDAASIASRGDVVRGEDGEPRIRLNWDKRYITLAAVATVHGLAFRLFDPENLLGRGEEPGITCALVPTNLDGVEIDSRHDPLQTPFINSPTRGRDVEVPIGAIIGGPEEAGNGWRMLMETLAAGRGIFLPAHNAGGDKLAARVTGAYARVRRQFGLPIAEFEGVAERLAPIGGLTWLADAMGTFVCGGLDAGAEPPVASAIAKLQGAEINRVVANHAMDVLGGKGIVLGPDNLLGYDYVAVPIAITVEGSNVVTRSLIVFGQGLIRCHPYALAELEALEADDVRAFDRAFWAHLRSIVRNAARAKLLSWTAGRVAGSPVSGPPARYWRRLSWASAVFANLADLALLSLGGALKKREAISGRFADALSWMFLALCGLRRWEAEGRPESSEPFFRWSVEHALWRVQEALVGVMENLPVPIVGPMLRVLAAPWLRLVPIGRPPSDRLSMAAAEALSNPGEARDALLEGSFVPADPDEPLAVLERALRLAVQSEPAWRKVRAAIKVGTVPDDDPRRVVDAALEAGVIDGEEHALLSAAGAARDRVVAVDDFDLETMPTSLPSVVDRSARGSPAR